MAKIDVTVTEDISASAEQVYAVLTNPLRMPAWVNGVESVQWEADSTLKPGDRFSMKYRYARRVSDITMEVTAVETGSRLEYHTVEGPYPIEASFALVPAGNETTVTYRQVAFSDSMMTRLGFLLTGWFAKSFVRRQLRKDLGKLAAIVAAEDTEAQTS